MGARPVIAAFPRRVEANPYCELLYDHLERLGVEVLEGRSGVRWLVAHRGRVRVLHFHWPERHFGRRRPGSALGFAARLLLARALGYRLVWTVHNLVPHDGTSAGDRLVRAVLRRTATLVVHCDAARGLLGRAGSRAIVIPHGNYVGRYPNAVTPAAARARLGLERDARVLLSFGQLRRYKGLDALVAAFATVPAPAARLVIAGQPLGDAAVPATRDVRVRVFPRHVPDAEVQLFLNAADVVVLPYRSVLTSGSAMLALSFGRGIVAPRVGCLAELERSGAALLYDPTDADGLAAALRRAVAVDPAALGERARRRAHAVRWETIARRHAAAYGFTPALALFQRPPGEGDRRPRVGRAR